MLRVCFALRQFGNIKEMLQVLDNCSFDLDTQKRILDNTINSDLIKRYPIKTSYQKAFLKLLIQKVYLKHIICFRLDWKVQNYFLLLLRAI